MLTFDTVAHHYGTIRSVHGIDIDLEQGKVVSLLGPSGCGKSTILRLAAGLESPSSGTIHLDGKAVAGGTNRFIPPEQRGVGFVFQDYALFPHLTVAENVLYGVNGGNGNAKKQRMLDALAQVNLTAYADNFPHTLSGGQQQRVAIARALVAQPKLLLLDEPYAGLDKRLKERVRDDMLHILKSRGTAVLMVTHDSEEAMFMSDYIYVMNDGTIAQEGRPIDLYCRPKSAFVAEFFGEVNRIDGVIVDNRLQTPFGDFAVGDSRAENASLIVRFEALTIATDSTTPNASVMETRLLGRYSLIHLSMPLADGGALHLHAKVPGLNMLTPGEPVALSVDPEQVFVFTD